MRIIKKRKKEIKNEQGLLKTKFNELAKLFKK